MRRAIRKLPKELVRTITSDQGKEMHRHVNFTIDTGAQIYFCDRLIQVTATAPEVPVMVAVTVSVPVTVLLPAV
jgi:hypothetical protein